MARTRRVIRIPEPPKDAFNKNRPAGTLLQVQLKHLRHGLSKHLEKVAALLAIDINSVKTEGDVSEYTKRVMAILHPHGGNSHRK